MKKIVILFAVLMLAQPVLAGNPNIYGDIMPEVYRCFHMQQQYNLHTSLLFENRTLYCVVDQPVKKQTLKIELRALPRPFVSSL